MSARTFTREFKIEVVRQLANGEKRFAQVCREHNLAQSVLCRWQKEYQERGENAFSARQATEISAAEALEQRITQLERHCGQLSLENALLKKLVSQLPSGSGIK